jgi:hypothetical protein
VIGLAPVRVGGRRTKTGGHKVALTNPLAAVGLWGCTGRGLGGLISEELLKTNKHTDITVALTLPLTATPLRRRPPRFLSLLLHHPPLLPPAVASYLSDPPP